MVTKIFQPLNRQTPPKIKVERSIKDLSAELEKGTFPVITAKVRFS